MTHVMAGWWCHVQGLALKALRRIRLYGFEHPVANVCWRLFLCEKGWVFCVFCKNVFAVPAAARPEQPPIMGGKRKTVLAVSLDNHANAGVGTACAVFAGACTITYESEALPKTRNDQIAWPAIRSAVARRMVVGTRFELVAPTMSR